MSGRDAAATTPSYRAFVSRNYSLPTIKTLFAEARVCAFPDCNEPLIFRDRGQVTAVADIAHIRSSTPHGPRFDETYTGDIDDPENLLLLCGKHHRPVDRHEAVYPAVELLTWKAAQQADARGGTPVSSADLRLFARLSDDDRRLLTEVARLAQRLRAACVQVQEWWRNIEEQKASEFRKTTSEWAAWDENDEGNRVPIPPERYSLSRNRELSYSQAAQRAWNDARPPIEAAYVQLSEELAVLRMTSGDLMPYIDSVQQAADYVVDTISTRGVVDESLLHLNGAVAVLWRVANGLEES